MMNDFFSFNPFGCEGKQNGKQEGNLPKIEVRLVKIPGDITGYQLTVSKGRITLSIGFDSVVQHSAGLSVYFAEFTGPWEVVLDETYEKERD